MKSLLYSLLLVSLAILTGSWGTQGHRKINGEASQSFNNQMADFQNWSIFLADHASDADYRKDEDPDEAPKHYIDIDNYYSFLYYGRIPQTLDSAIDLYGESFVYDNGILPFAIIASVEELQHYFEVGDIDAAMALSADLGHYVGDAHNPLHITANYNGQLTGNEGIHSRYETSMVNAFIDEIQYSGDEIAVVDDVTKYVFDFIYHNHLYVDSILMADDYAQSVAGSTSSYAYKQALWDATGNFTTLLMKNASHALTELIYTAWVNAGSPSLTSFAINEPDNASENSIQFIEKKGTSIRIGYQLSDPGPVSLSILTLLGEKTIVLDNRILDAGDYEINWNSAGSASGLYLVEYATTRSREVKKFILTR